MRKLRIVPIHESTDPTEKANYFLIQDIESHAWFVWQQASREVAEETLDNLARSWERDPLERAKDLQINFVNMIERTLFRRSKT